MEMIFTRLTAVFMSLITWFNVVFFPQNIEGIFTEPDEEIVQTQFDEGKFIMGEFDIVVAPNGDDSNPGTQELPLKTPEGAKEKAKELVGVTDNTVTVWFREGTYLLENPLEFTSQDLSNVVYRSYPDETVSFTGAKEISGWTETTINGISAFVTDIPINNEDDYFRSLFKGSKRLSRSNYPKEGVFKIADPLTEEGIPSEWSAEFFTHALSFKVHTSDILDFE